MKRMPLILLLQACVFVAGYAHATDEDLKKRNLSDTVLLQRNLLIADPFDAQKALLQLFPGNYYDLSSDGYTNKLISWECSTCTPKACPDVNEIEENNFPDKDGVATRLLNVMDFSDASGMKYKVISFNHSEYDTDGIMTGRFSGGILGLAKFVQTPEGWKLRMFQPMIGAYGAFSHCPEPVPILIGQDQYAFLIRHLNGGAGGPFTGAFFLIAGDKGTYQQVMSVYGTERTEGGEEEPTCFWKSEIRCAVSDKQFFRDIIVTTKGTYYASDKEGMPDIVSSRIKGKQKGSFTIEQRYVYKGKGYESAGPAICTVQ